MLLIKVQNQLGAGAGARVSASHLLPTASGARAAPNCSIGTRPPRLCQQRRPKHPAPPPPAAGSRDGGEKVGERLAGAPPPARRARGAQILFHPPRLRRPARLSGAGRRRCHPGDGERNGMPLREAGACVRSASGQIGTQCARGHPTPGTLPRAPARRERVRKGLAGTHPESLINGVSMNEHAGPGLRKRRPCAPGLPAGPGLIALGEHWAEPRPRAQRHPVSNRHPRG